MICMNLSFRVGVGRRWSARLSPPSQPSWGIRVGMVRRKKGGERTQTVQGEPTKVLQCLLCLWPQPLLLQSEFSYLSKIWLGDRFILTETPRLGISKSFFLFGEGGCWNTEKILGPYISGTDQIRPLPSALPHQSSLVSPPTPPPAELSQSTVCQKKYF